MALTAEQQQTLVSTNAGTPMGELLRRYWIPALLAQELPEPDCAPVRVRLRCTLTGRARANYRKFKLCRIALRDLASAGQIPGMVKASW